MTRYIDADKFKSHLEKAMEKMHIIAGVKAVDVGAVIKALDMQPTADVVPKSEVDLYRKQVDELEDELASTYDKLENAKAEIETLKDNNEHLAVMLEETKIELDAMRGAANSLKMHYEKAEAEVRRLRGILLQFTDIVHKWGAKNNIDTSEISLVPILQEEADSIIKNANQEYASEIFAEINMQIIPYSTDIYIKGEELIIIPKSDYNAILTKLKKKYTEGEG